MKTRTTRRVPDCTRCGAARDGYYGDLCRTCMQNAHALAQRRPLAGALYAVERACPVCERPGLVVDLADRQSVTLHWEHVTDAGEPAIDGACWTAEQP